MKQKRARTGLAIACLSLIGAVALLGPGAGSAAAEGEAPCPNEALRVEQHSTLLPDCRAYELVSAADKNGADVIGDPKRVRIADDGSAVGYASLMEFGDSVGGGVATEYMSVRSPQAGGQGWVTHGIMARQPALTFTAAGFEFEPRYEQDFSPDLQRGVLFAWRPVTNDPLVANVANLYWRDDLRTPGGGDYRLVSGCPLCIGPLSSDFLRSQPVMLASTPDLSRVLFESTINLTPGAVGGGTKLYEWDASSGHVVLAGILPNGTGAFDSAAGRGHGDYEHRHAISADGRKVFFIATVAGIQNVYMRLDESSTVQLNLPEAGGPSTASAGYGDATPDGSHVIFTTRQQLTPDAPSHGGIYSYDTTLPASDPNHLRFISPGGEIVGVSADGNTIYFMGNGAILPGHSGVAVYVWHDGNLAFVNDITSEDETTLVESPTGTTSRVSPSGSMMFLSDAPTAADPPGSCPNSFTRACSMLYVYTPAAGARPVCVSCHPDGSPPNAGVQVIYVVSEGGGHTSDHLYRLLSDDGHRVFFTTAEALLPEDINGKLDVYEYDLTTNTLSLISSGRSTADSYFMDSTPSGNDALFATREQLVGWDTDTNYDIYDARVGGGFPEPTPPPLACTGPDCRPTPTTPPPDLNSASQSFHGAGNAKHKNRCSKGTQRAHRKGKGRCVRKHRGKKR